jgi:hypothetical protein
MRTVVIWIVMSFASSLLSQGQSIPINESPPPARTYHLLREDDDWSFLRIRPSGRSFGIPSNIFLCDQAGMTGSSPWVAKLVRFGNRLETTTGANSRS